MALLPPVGCSVLQDCAWPYEVPECIPPSVFVLTFTPAGLFLTCRLRCYSKHPHSSYFTALISPAQTGTALHPDCFWMETINGFGPWYVVLVQLSLLPKRQ